MGIKPINVKITGDDQASKVIESAGKKADRFGKNIESIGRISGKIGLGMMGAGLGAAFVAGITKIPGHILKVEEAMALLGFTENFTAEQSEMVGKSVRRMSRDFIQDEVALISGVDKLGDAGFSLHETLSTVLPMAAKQATAFNKTLDTTTRIAYSLGTQFKVLPGQMGAAIDMTSELARANFDLDELATNILPRLGQAADGLNMNGLSGFAEMAADLEIINSKMKDGGATAKAYSKVLEGMRDPEVMKRFQAGPGVNVLAELDGAKKRGESELTAYLKMVKRVTDSRDENIRTTRLNDLFGKEDVHAVRAILDAGDKRGEGQKKYMDSLGVTQKGFEIQAATNTRQWEKFKNTVQGTDFGPTTKGVSVLSEALKWLNEDAKNAETAIWGVLGVITAGGTLSAFSSLVNLLAAAKTLKGEPGIPAPTTVPTGPTPAGPIPTKGMGKLGMGGAIGIPAVLAYGAYRAFQDGQAEGERQFAENKSGRKLTQVNTGFGGLLPVTSFDSPLRGAAGQRPHSFPQMSGNEMARAVGGGDRAAAPARVEGEVVVRLEGFPAATKVATKSNGIDLHPERGASW